MIELLIVLAIPVLVVLECARRSGPRGGRRR